MSIEQDTFPNTRNQPSFPSCELIRRSLEGAVREALTKDWDLVALGCHEQAISHRIAVYLEHRLPGFNIDCEYNRREYQRKSFTNDLGEVRNMRPDIIAHQRLSPVNLLAVEIKAHSNPDSPNDSTKLKALACRSEYQYKVAAFVRILNATQDLCNGVLCAEILWYARDQRGVVTEENNITPIKVDDRTDEVLQIYKTRKNQS